MTHRNPRRSKGTQLIINADDFGRSSEINQAVLRAHHEGILTSASLMVAGSAADEAVEMARRTPTLAVGLHVVMVDGPALLSRDDASHLLNAGGQFPDEPLRLGMRYLANASARQELRREIKAQFHRFAATGLPLSHVDGHQHMHLHPVIFPLIVRLAREHGAAGIRLPRDQLRLALERDAGAMFRKVAWAATLGPLSHFLAWRMPTGMRTPQRCYGLFQSGRMTEQYVVNVLKRLRGGTAEIYFHPTAGARMNPLGPNQTDLQTLLSPVVRHVVATRSLRLTTYRNLSL